MAVVGCSTDSHYAHLAWQLTPRDRGGIAGVKYPLVADATKTISANYDVLGGHYDYTAEGEMTFIGSPMAYRGLFLIDKDGIVRHQLVNDRPLGRSISEALRMIDALLHFEENGEACPADWTRSKQFPLCPPGTDRINLASSGWPTLRNFEALLFLYNIGLGLLWPAAAPAGSLRAQGGGLGGGAPGASGSHPAARLAADAAPRVWFHCASLGEFEQGRPLLEAYRRAHPGYQAGAHVLLALGLRGAEGLAGGRLYFLPAPGHAPQCPGFSGRGAAPAGGVCEVRVLVPFPDAKLRRRGIPAIVVSAIFRPDQVFFKPWGGFFRQILARFTHIFTQNEPRRRCCAAWA